MNRIKLLNVEVDNIRRSVGGSMEHGMLVTPNVNDKMKPNYSTQIKPSNNPFHNCKIYKN